MILFAENVHENVLQDVPVRHMVFSIPKRIRAFFRYNRSRHGLLFRAAWEAIREYYQAALPDGVPGSVMALHTAGSLLEHNPHLHCVTSDGMFLPDGTFVELGFVDCEKLQALFEHKLLSILLHQGIISQTVVSQITSWKHSGFSVWVGPQARPADTDARLFISEYVNKAQVKMNRIEILDTDSGSVVRYHKDEHTFRDFTPLQFLAQLSAQIPNRWEQCVRFFGEFSARTRGRRRKLAAAQQQEPNLKLPLPEAPSKKKASASWARLIRKIYLVDPLECPKCQGPMRIIAFITKPTELKRICDNLGIPEYRAPPPLTPSRKTSDAYEPLPHVA
jgi:hypothetical protein